MNYFFITIMHNMNLDIKLNKGIELAGGTRISNGPEVRIEILDNLLLRSTAGVHSINEFYDTVYYYKKGNFPYINTHDEMDVQGSMFTFYFLREAQGFLTDLWQVKDNGIYIRDGFLIAYDNQIEDGRTFKASLTETFSTSSGTRDLITFSKNEIQKAVQTFEPFILEELSEENFGGKNPSFNHFYKNKGPQRMHKANYFTLAARNNIAPPMKILMYCTALECLFSTAKTEINHRIAERVAFMLGRSVEEKKDLFTFIKKAYDLRSTIVHGSSLKGNEEYIAQISIRLDEILRQFLLGSHDVFTKSDSEIDDFFVDLLFN
ncbi:hypothetical protein [Paenibacillus chitinolyticus]|uniref:hypothetical protein n=1 Tax=Paenibacillus chitinolyticus TaxID=79263 RepID=UPI00366E7192